MFDDYYGLGLWEFAIFFLFIGIFVLYYFAQYNLLKAIEPQNRLMPPSSVFLQLIPIFGSIYAFLVVGKIADSIRLEADSREMIDLGTTDSFGNSDLLSKPLISIEEQRPTYGIGIAKCILGICGLLPTIGNYINLAWMVCFIIYWVKLVKIKNMILAL